MANGDGKLQNGIHEINEILKAEETEATKGSDIKKKQRHVVVDSKAQGKVERKRRRICGSKQIEEFGKFRSRRRSSETHWFDELKTTGLKSLPRFSLLSFRFVSHLWIRNPRIPIFFFSAHPKLN